jgi:DNA-binding LytR/AlgR family response regulator
MKPLLQVQSTLAISRLRSKDVGTLSTEASMKMRVAGKKNLINLNDVAFLKSAKNYTIFRLKNGVELISSKTLGIFEEELQSVTNFVRPHRSYIVNFDYVNDLRFNCRGGELYLDDEVIKISRRKAAEFRRQYRKFLTAIGANVTSTIRRKTKLRVN